VAAVHLLDLDAEPLAGDAPLELEREEAVLARRQHRGRPVRPAFDRERFVEEALGGDALVLGGRGELRRVDGISLCGPRRSAAIAAA
jgi:hypothetical protein